MNKTIQSVALLAVALSAVLLQGCNLTSTSKNAALESTSQAGNSVKSSEEKVLEIYKGNMEDKEKVPAIIEQLGHFNWSELDNKADESGKSLEIIEYLYNNKDDIPSEDYPVLFQASEGLDGALAESYSAIVGELFKQHKEIVVKTVSEIEDKTKQEQIVGFIGYYLSYKDIAQEKKDIENWLASGKVDTKEEAVLKDLLNKLDHPY